MSESVPKYFFYQRGNAEVFEKRTQNLRPSVSQMIKLLPLSMRYMWWFCKKKFQRRKPNIDSIRMLTGKHMYGVPLGGIGAGTIGRGFRGEFCRFQIMPGFYKYDVVSSDLFIVVVRKIEDGKPKVIFQSVLGVKTKPYANLTGLEWNIDSSDIHYYGLYPRSWTVYNIPQINIKLVCQQVSPVIPHNYKDSCLPVAAFIWTIENMSSADLSISIIQTLKASWGHKTTSKMDSYVVPFTTDDVALGLVLESGMVFGQENAGSLSFAVHNLSKIDTKVSWCSFSGKNELSRVWHRIAGDAGKLDSLTMDDDIKVKATGGVIAAELPVIGARSSSQIIFAMAWARNSLQFRGCGRKYTPRYRRWFGIDPNDSICSVLKQLLGYTFRNFEAWTGAIERWQHCVLGDSQLPDWFKSAIFNEMYYLSDGGSVWVEFSKSDGAVDEDDPRIDFGRFAYLEGHEYRLYNTYDVHFYASFALISLFPKLQHSIQTDFYVATIAEDEESVLELYSGVRSVRNALNFIPHDLGDPEEEPFIKVNAYCIHNVATWKDLGLKFIISIWRDCVWDSNNCWLIRHSWSTCQHIVELALKNWDTDNDGLIENSGFPDQTYDSWIMIGPSAYCGSLWLAALAAMVEMADLLGKDNSEYRRCLERASASFFDRLWNGKFFNFDENKKSTVIMADQLCGQWYLQLCGLGHRVFPKDKVISSLKCIYEKNVLLFRNGSMGAVNGMITDGNIDRTSVQSEEMWTGVSYGLASLMMAEGLIQEAWRTAEGVYRTVYEKIGMAYETPEALYEKNHYRSIGYMRPLSIWSIYEAWKQLHSKDS